MSDPPFAQPLKQDLKAQREHEHLYAEFERLRLRLGLPDLTNHSIDVSAAAQGGLAAAWAAAEAAIPEATMLQLEGQRDGIYAAWCLSTVDEDGDIPDIVGRALGPTPEAALDRLRERLREIG